MWLLCLRMLSYSIFHIHIASLVYACLCIYRYKRSYQYISSSKAYLSLYTRAIIYLTEADLPGDRLQGLCEEQ